MKPEGGGGGRRREAEGGRGRQREAEWLKEGLCEFVKAILNAMYLRQHQGRIKVEKRIDDGVRGRSDAACV